MSGRSGIANSQDVVFPFVVTLPSLCSLTGTNRELALSIQGSNSQALKHQHTPLRLIQKWLGHPEQSFFDTIFVYQKFDFPKNTSALQWETMQEDAFVDVMPPCKLSGLFANLESVFNISWAWVCRKWFSTYSCDMQGQHNTSRANRTTSSAIPRSFYRDSRGAWCF